MMILVEFYYYENCVGINVLNIIILITEFIMSSSLTRLDQNSEIY